MTQNYLMILTQRRNCNLGANVAFPEDNESITRGLFTTVQKYSISGNKILVDEVTEVLLHGGKTSFTWRRGG